MVIRNNLIKIKIHHNKKPGLKVFSVLLILLYGSINGQPRFFKNNFSYNRFDNDIIHLVLTIGEKNITISRAVIEKGTVSNHSNITHRPGYYKFVLLNYNGDLVYSDVFRDPTLIFYDELQESNEQLTGGIIKERTGMVDIKIPNLPNTELQIFSPENSLLLQQSLESIIKKKQVLKKTTTDFEFETILQNGDSEYLIDILVMGDGYTVNDTAKFRQDVQTNVVEHLVKYISPYKEYQSYFNVHLIQLISEESGADHPELNPPVYKNTYLDATYNYFNIARLIGCNNQKVYTTANEAFPEYDKIILLINDEAYGGSGGIITISYTGYFGTKVLSHEFGHSFGDLLDEYLYSTGPGDVDGCNCDDDAIDPKWKIWIDVGTPDIGTFPGCSYGNYYRPTDNYCMMNILKDFYCPVCREGITRTINANANLVKSFSPADSTQDMYLSSKLTFSIEQFFETNESLVTSWYINNEIENNWNGNTFEFSPPAAGIYSIIATVTDTTDFVLNDPRFDMLDGVEWRVNVLDDILPTEFQITQNYPNPFNSGTNIQYYVPDESIITLKVYDQLGQEIAVLVNENKSEGWYELQFDGSNISSSIYFYSISNGKKTITKKMILLR